jgi:hypothetical protein
MRKHSLGPDHQEPLSLQSDTMTNPKDSTPGLGRRSFLLRAATSAVVVTANHSVMAQYQNEPDPILAAIENHKAAYRKVEVVVSEHARLESILPRGKRQSIVHAWEQNIVERMIRAGSRTSAP